MKHQDNAHILCLAYRICGQADIGKHSPRKKPKELLPLFLFSHKLFFRPEAEKIILVMDNLNTHSIASLYKRFPPCEARRIRERLEIHHTPKHGSWLNMAEIELNVMTRQCLNRRIDNIENIRKELLAWESMQNNAKRKIRWHFTTDDARTKLVSLYPVVDII